MSHALSPDRRTRALATGEGSEIGRGDAPRHIGPIDRPAAAPTLSSRRGDEIDDVAHRDLDPLGGERGDTLVGDPAGHDAIEPGEVRVDVEREAVHRPPLGDPYADRRNLARTQRVAIDPDTGAAWKSPCLDPEIGEHIDQHLFDPVDVGGRVGHAATPLPGHGENRVAHELTRTVIGDVSAPVRVDDRSAHRLDIDKQVVSRRAPTQRHDMVVLEQEQVVLGRVITQLALQGDGVSIVDSAEPANSQTGGRDFGQVHASMMPCRQTVRQRFDSRSRFGERGRSDQRISASQSRVSRIS